MEYELDFTSKFNKDIKLIEKQGKELKKLFEIINILACGNKLPDSYKDHKLHGDYENFRECHIEPDWLLIYKVTGSVLVLYRTGSHSNLFE